LHKTTSGFKKHLFIKLVMVKYLISFLTILFLLSDLCLAQKDELLSPEFIFHKGNLQLRSKSFGKVHYVASIKPFQSPEPDIFKIQLSYNKTAQNSDSISEYILNIDNQYIHIAFNSELFISNIKSKSIDVFSIDNVYNKSFSKLISSTGRHLFKPLVYTKEHPLVSPQGYMFQKVDEVVLNDLEYYKVSFASLDTLHSNYGYDSTIYHFRKSNFNLFKYERVLYDTFELNTQRLIYDEIIFDDSNAFNTTISAENYLDSLQNQNYSVNVIDPNGNEFELVQYKIQSPVSNWKALDNLGNYFELENIKSRLILFDFSYLSCQYCLKSLPMLNDLFKMYDRNDLTVCWIDPYDYEKREFVSLQFIKRNIEFPVYYDIDRSAIKEYGISSYPQLFLVESNSLNLIKTIGGHSETNKAVLIEEIDKYLSK